MAEQSDSQQTAKIPQLLTLRSGVCSVDIKDETDIVFKDKETGKIRKAHKILLSQASPFFNTWFKEQWQKEKATTEYPVPGDIDWEEFKNVISFLYGNEVQFEEEALPKIYKAADFLQLDNLKEVIVTCLNNQWELKDSSIVGAMCTAIAPHTDPRVVSRLLYMVSVRYLIRNIPTIVENDNIDISPLPLDTMMEIAQSEKVAVPEIELYNFLRKWAEKHKHRLTFMEVQTLFGHVRYATIPHPELERIKKHAFNDNERLQSALSEAPDFSKTETVETKQYTNRKSQEGQLLLNGPQYKKWITKVTNFPTESSLYTVISDKKKGAIVLTNILKDRSEETSRTQSAVVYIDVYTLSKSHAKQSIPQTVSHRSYSKLKNSLKVSFRNTVVMYATPTGIQVEKPDQSGQQTLQFTEPFPWLVIINNDSMSYHNTVAVQAV